MNKISKKFILYGVAIIFLLSMSFVSTIYAKYVSNVESGSLVKPNSFYFSTNYEDKQFYELFVYIVTVFEIKLKKHSAHDHFYVKKYCNQKKYVV